MKPTVVSPSRLSCRIVRAWSSLNGSTPAAHCATCPECQAFFAVGDALENALRHEASSPRAHVTPSIGFEQRLARAVRESAPQAERRKLRTPLYAWAGVGAAAAIALTVVWQRGPGFGSSGAAEFTPENVTAMLDAAGSLTERWETRVVPATGGMVAQNPLQDEASAVVADGRRVVSFLAANFLPSRSG